VGQKLISTSVRKLADVRKRIDASGLPVRLEVDGGVKEDNIRALAQAGADTFVAGSAIFGSKDYVATLRALRAQIAV
jgi:ribulose-phosphate 3-epimerase